MRIHTHRMYKQHKSKLDTLLDLHPKKTHDPGEQSNNQKVNNTINKKTFGRKVLIN